jgi:hypothetical protein
MPWMRQRADRRLRTVEEMRPDLANHQIPASVARADGGDVEVGVEGHRPARSHGRVATISIGTRSPSAYRVLVTASFVPTGRSTPATRGSRAALEIPGLVVDIGSLSPAPRRNRAIAAVREGGYGMADLPQGLTRPLRRGRPTRHVLRASPPSAPDWGHPRRPHRRSTRSGTARTRPRSQSAPHFGPRVSTWRRTLWGWRP